VQEALNPPVFSAGVRWSVSIVAFVAGAAMVVATGPARADGGEATDGYVLVHALTALPYLLATLVFTVRALQVGPPEYRAFWQRWLAANVLGTAAAIVSTLAGATRTPWLLHVNMALIMASAPLWVSATVLMARAQAGRRSVSVDVVDAATALLVLGAPGVLLVAEPLADSEHLAFALPFAATAVFAPATVYLSLVTLGRIPRGERAAQGLGVALGAAAGVNLTLQLARLLGGLELPLRTFVLVHAVNMALFALTPLWAHRRPTGRAAAVPAEEQVRRTNPMPYVAAGALPLLGVWVFATRDDHPWSVWFLLVVTVVVVLLNAVRYTAMNRETRRLYAGIAQMAEERRTLLARLLRVMESDHHRTATELHSQAVGSLATLGTLVQMAHVALPGDTAVTVKETISALQGDLSAKAEHLRQLMIAIRPPAGDDTLAAALAASASDVEHEGTSPTVRVEIDPQLQLDWPTMTIVYRIAQEAVLTAARWAGASAITVTIGEDGGSIVLKVHDDGHGLDDTGPAATALATMRLLAELGGGTLTTTPAPNGTPGTALTCTLPTVLAVPTPPAPVHGDPPTGQDRPTRHLHTVPAPPHD
jgi:signal transduction histidine kinase